MKANCQERCKAVLDVVQTWLVKRKVSLKHLDGVDQAPRVSGKEYRLECTLKEGISQENTKKIGKDDATKGLETVKPQIQGDELPACQEPPRNLQAVMSLLRDKDLDVALQFTQLPLTASSPRGP